MWVQVLFLVLGSTYLGKIYVPDSALCVYSKIATISENIYALNRNGLMTMLSPISGKKILLSWWWVPLPNTICFQPTVFQR